jgi:uncharacterized protein YebE (UPF0316 family)
MPLVIIGARILDVSIGTVRIILISKGRKRIAPILGFFEVLIWIVVVKHLIMDVSHWTGYIAYATGFALGTYIGMYLDEKMVKGKVLVRIIIRKNAEQIINELEKEWTITVSDGDGSHGPVKIIFMVIEREEFLRAIGVVKKYNPRAFYSVEDVKHARESEHLPVRRHILPSGFLRIRKGK